MTILDTAAIVDLDSFKDEVALLKSSLRKMHLRQRAKASTALREALAARLVEEGLAHIQAFRRGGAGWPETSLYSPIENEPHIEPLAEALDAHSVPLSLPVDYSTGAPLIYRRWHPGDRLMAGPLGISEPSDDAIEIRPDVLIVPALAFDRQGYRLGYGVGNVDSTLRVLRKTKTILVIGVAYASQEEAALPSTPRDEPVDMIVTERETIDCRNART